MFFVAEKVEEVETVSISQLKNRYRKNKSKSINMSGKSASRMSAESALSLSGTRSSRMSAPSAALVAAMTQSAATEAAQSEAIVPAESTVSVSAPSASAMKDFTKDEDMSLLLLVPHFERGQGDIDWQSVLEQMSPTTRTIEDLEDRLHHLKTADPSMLQGIPKEYFGKTSLLGPRTNRPQQEIYNAIDKIFGHLTKSDVRQPSGQTHLNVGEIAPIGVTKILEVLDLNNQDVFLDVGSGTGSILAQVVLQSPAREAIGLEIQEDLVKKSSDAIAAGRQEYDRLFMVRIQPGNVNNIVEWDSATILFCNSILFQDDDKLLLFNIASNHLNLRLLVLSEQMCPRCSNRCTKPFCKAWTIYKTVMAEVCWRDKPIEIFVYKRAVKNASLQFVQDM
jgi:Histone methylation protein DOT1